MLNILRHHEEFNRYVDIYELSFELNDNILYLTYIIKVFYEHNLTLNVTNKDLVSHVIAQCKTASHVARIVVTGLKNNITKFSIVAELLCQCCGWMSVNDSACDSGLSLICRYWCESWATCFSWTLDTYEIMKYWNWSFDKQYTNWRHKTLRKLNQYHWIL